MSLKVPAAMSAVVLVASASLASTQVAAQPERSRVQSEPYHDSYFNKEYWNDIRQFMVPSDPDPTKGTVFETR